MPIEPADKMSASHPQPASQHPNPELRSADSTLPPPRPHPLASALQACLGSVPKKTATAWAQFTSTIAQLESEPVRGRPSEMIRVVLEAGYENYLKENYPNYRQRLEDLQQLASYALQFKTTEEFLTQLALLSNLDAEQDRPSTQDDEQLRLSTVHQAKGLEFSVVFVIMLCEGLFPAARSLDEEEERRLFYVALTRAKNELYLTYPMIRMTAGSSGDFMQQPSRFLSDLPDDLIEEWNLSSFNPYG
ncbi:MAG: ATP-binding domain-containing protein [Verrucomicrobia bacterium]|nr:ATP-binding domain-containing protein [Verrucomicrobiota bacterium]